MNNKRVLITGGSGFIGAYLVDELLQQKKYDLINIDKNVPPEEQHKPYWKNIDLLNAEELIKTVKDFQPWAVIHLAARTDTLPETVMDDYKSNTEGTANILAAIKACECVERVIITSTQFVNQYHGFPKHDEDFAPHTVYGESKVISEKMVRGAALASCWTIIRPTNIWGPRHPRYPTEFWYVLKKGRYIHPGKEPVIRSYGYVGNVVQQIIQLLEKSPELINKQVFYVGDEPINLYDWANGFSLALNQKKITVFPRFFIKVLAITGDILRKFKIKFPITSSRYRSMTNSNTAPMEKTFKILGPPKYTLQQGIEETVAWLKTKDNFWSK